jgi:hypothetical protein
MLSLLSDFILSFLSNPYPIIGSANSVLIVYADHSLNGKYTDVKLKLSYCETTLAATLVPH